jgi:hypothetical protein
MKLIVEIEIIEDKGWIIDRDQLVDEGPPDDRSMILLTPTNVLDNLIIMADDISDPPFKVLRTTAISLDTTV